MKIKKHILPFQNKYLTGITLAVLFLLSTLAAGAREARDTIIPSSITARPTWNGAVDSAWFIADVTATQTRKVSGATIIQRVIKYTDSTQMLAAYLAAINSHTAQLASHLSSINLNTAAVALINVNLPKKVDSVKVIGTTLYYYANGGIAYPAGTVTTSGGGGAWGTILGTLSAQTDLQSALNAKATAGTTLGAYGITDAYTKSQIATVGTTGRLSDLQAGGATDGQVATFVTGSGWIPRSINVLSLNHPQTDTFNFSGSYTFTLRHTGASVVTSISVFNPSTPMNINRVYPGDINLNTTANTVTISNETIPSGGIVYVDYDNGVVNGTIASGTALTGYVPTAQSNGSIQWAPNSGSGLAPNNQVGYYENGFSQWGRLVGDSIPVFSGTYSPLAGTVASGDNLYQAIRKLDGNIALRATLASPTFSGVPVAPTAANGTNSGQVATTAFVQAAVAASTAGVSSYNTRTGAVVSQQSDYSSFYFPLAGGSLTGTGGLGYIGKPTQSTRPAAPPAGTIYEFTDSLARRAYENAAGRTRAFDYRANGTDVVFNFQNKSGGYTVADSADIIPQARLAISLTTLGTGAASYDNTTGILNIPTPQGTPVTQTVTAGGAQTISNTTTWFITDPTVVQASEAITFPATPPIDGEIISMSFGGTIINGTVVTSLTFTANTGQHILASSLPPQASAGDTFSFQWKASNTTWYRIN